MPATIATALAAAASIALAPAAVSLTATGASAQTAHALATAKPNLRACYDGKCDLTLTGSVSFRVSGSRFGITRLAISFTADTVLVKGTGPGVASQAMLGKGTSGSVNRIGVQVVSLSAGKAVLRLAPKS
ncbi:hypothetical protein GCM10022224_092110 [Nonomuraea antimicrobica]|uniref:Uncharacterized protein n=1 Tax=Nonomuraea antimicrobica TaxID=561173 RepID=A0ABP7E1H0_9ACTN